MPKNVFERFDVVSDVSDHHFRYSNNGQCFTDSKSNIYRSIMKEWKILEQNLPESIYVRVYERRIDLMRAVIVGAAGTPYHDGLFVFDIRFPSYYPRQPPMVFFHSFGYRINPNLYVEGKVCLSLLNTWDGKGSELWDPSRSTILQVLVSIQGLVLNEKPYFNEPMRVFNFERKSRAYNENVFLINCKISNHLLRKPPRNLEAFVSCFFYERAVQILKACNEYANGRVRIGYYSSSDLARSSSRVQVSREFKDQMIELYPQLLHGFQLNGSSIDPSLHHLNLGTNKSQRSNKKTTKVFKKLMEKIKRTLGWKKNTHVQAGDATLTTSSK